MTKGPNPPVPSNVSQRPDSAESTQYRQGDILIIAVERAPAA